MKSQNKPAPQLKDIKGAIMNLSRDLGSKLINNPKARNFAGFSVSILIHIAIYGLLIILSALENPDVLEIREITFVDETSLPAINRPKAEEALPLEPDPLEEELFPSRAGALAESQIPAVVSQASISLAERMDMQRKQAPINLARNASVLANNNSDILKISPAQGTKLDSRVKNPSAPINLARKGAPELAYNGNAAALSLDESAKPTIALNNKELTTSPISTRQTSSGQTGKSLPEKTSASLTPKASATVITGQLASRKIVHKVIPEFPAAARRQGVGASIALSISVMETGDVKENIIIVRTSGSREWDKTVIEAMKKWQFAPLDTKGQRQDQTGIITFQFVIR